MPPHHRPGPVARWIVFLGNLPLAAVFLLTAASLFAPDTFAVARYASPSWGTAPLIAGVALVAGAFGALFARRWAPPLVLAPLGALLAFGVAALAFSPGPIYAYDFKLHALLVTWLLVNAWLLRRN